VEYSLDENLNLNGESLQIDFTFLLWAERFQ